MENFRFCQSCGMPFDNPELLGTRKDGSLSKEYCKYCFKDGVFTNPALTLATMKAQIVEKMNRDHLPADIIDMAVTRLPFLKRWKARKPEVKKESTVPEDEAPNEKHPLERPPGPEHLASSEEDLDQIRDDWPEDSPIYEIPEPGEGP